MASRRIEDLHPALQPLAREFLSRCSARQVDVLIVCTYRDGAEQDALYAQGRTKPGARVTNAKAGQSAHNHTIDGKPAARAFDAVPLLHGKPIWEDPRDADAGEECPHLLLEFLGAGAALGELRRPAFRAVGGEAGDQSAAVADPPIARLVEREGEVALAAAGTVAAGPALDMGGEAAPVEQEHHLPPRGERPLDPRDEPGAQGPSRPALRVTQIDGDHRRQLGATDAVREPAHPP
jgi:peptidoglycan L-alanyl-D-glutamate endopeptidase CwlK